MTEISFIEPFPISFKKLFDAFERKEIGFIGFDMDDATIWLPVEYDEGEQIEKVDFFDLFPEVMLVLFSWGDQALNFMSEVVAYIRKKRGDLKELRNIDHSVCKKCGGKCCRNTGCYFSTRDFDEISYESLYSLLSKGYTSISPTSGALTGLENSLLLKVRNVNDPIVIFDELEPSRCILLGENGCSLKDGERPYGGSSLIPMAEASCIIGYTLREAVEEWAPYQNLLMKLAKEFIEKDIPFKGID